MKKERTEEKNKKKRDHPPSLTTRPFVKKLDSCNNTKTSAPTGKYFFLCHHEPDQAFLL